MAQANGNVGNKAGASGTVAPSASAVKRKLDLPDSSARPGKLAAAPPLRVVAPFAANTSAFAGLNFAAPSSDPTDGDGSAPEQHSAADLVGDNPSSNFAAGAAPGPAPDPKRVQPSGGMFQGHLVINLDDEPDHDLPAAAEASSSQGMTTRRGANTSRAAGNDAAGRYNVTVPMQFVMTEETKKYYEKTGINEIQHAIMTSIKSLIDSKKKK
jgi:hypothetical protein